MTIEAQDEVNYAGKKVAAGRPCRRRLARGIMDRDRENEPRAIGDLRLWDAYCAAEAALINSRMRLAREAADLPAVVREALGGADRGPALRLLADSPVESSVPHLDRLVRLACVSHREIELSRLLVAKLHARGYRNEIARVVDDVLATGGVTNSGESPSYMLRSIHPRCVHTSTSASRAPTRRCERSARTSRTMCLS